MVFGEWEYPRRVSKGILVDHEFEVLAQVVHLRIEPDSCVLEFNFAILQK